MTECIINKKTSFSSDDSSFSSDNNKNEKLLITGFFTPAQTVVFLCMINTILWYGLIKFTIYVSNKTDKSVIAILGAIIAFFVVPSIVIVILIGLFTMLKKVVHGIIKIPAKALNKIKGTLINQPINDRTIRIHDQYIWSSWKQIWSRG